MTWGRTTSLSLRRPPGLRTLRNRFSLYRPCIENTARGRPARGDGVAVFKLTTQADSDNSICFGGRRWGAYLRRKDRANSFANRESSSVLIITHVWKHNEVSESGFTTTPSALKPSGRRFGEDGHANVLRYQVNRLLSRNNVVRVFRSDSLTSCRVHELRHE